MADAAIRLEGVSKRFRIYYDRHQSLKEILLKRSRGRWHDLWALRDVHLEIPPGETVGVIGENGAGKSTMLKLLAGILVPDGGRITTRGRVSSLLELGAGFQGEYTGRENIYLYGALLGLRRREIRGHFNDIVEFSELGSAIEYPVKNYSSGMYMRLAFAVAVHLDPEVLLIDEVLAVGDAAFQQKCYERLQTFKRERRTIVLVSHDLEAVRRFCERTVWIDHGQVAADGPSDSSIAAYLDSSASRPGRAGENVDIPGLGRATGRAQITGVHFRDAEGRDSRTFISGDPLTLEIDYTAEEALPQATVGVSVFRNDGTYVLDANTLADHLDVSLPVGAGRIRLDFPSFSVGAGTYDVSIAIYDAVSNQVHDFHQRRYPFTIRKQRDAGAVAYLDHEWRITRSGTARRRAG